VLRIQINLPNSLMKDGVSDTELRRTIRKHLLEAIEADEREAEANADFGCGCPGDGEDDGYDDYYDENDYYEEDENPVNETPKPHVPNFTMPPIDPMMILEQLVGASRQQLGTQRPADENIICVRREFTFTGPESAVNQYVKRDFTGKEFLPGDVLVQGETVETHVLGKGH